MAYKYPYDIEKDTYKPPKLRTDRSMWKLAILDILTLGIYGIIFFMPLAADLDKIDPPRERDKTMSFMIAYLLSLFTFSIVMTVWHYHIAARIEEALARRNIEYDFSTSDFWSWYFFGSFILVGPFIYLHKLCKAMNLLCQSYNEKPILD